VSARWLVVGLGNPGARYAESRHNVGFRVAELLAADAGLSWRGAPRLDAEAAVGALGGGISAVLLKPQTYMNLSGQSVVAAARFYRVEPGQLLVLHDDIDLPLGRLRVKRGGGDGGHRGIRSMIERLGEGDFIRVRIGVGRPRVGEVTDHVLGGFQPADRPLLERALVRAADAATMVLREGLSAAMNRHNRAEDEDPPAAGG